MELFAHIKNDARRSAWLEAENSRPERYVHIPKAHRRAFLPLAATAAVLILAVVGLFLLRQAGGPRFTPGPSPQAGGNSAPALRTSESAQASAGANKENAAANEAVTSVAAPEPAKTSAPTPPPTEAPENPDNPYPSVPMEEIVPRKEIVEITENGLKREIYASGQQHKLLIPFIDTANPEDKGLQGILDMIAAGCGVSVTTDSSWQDAPPEEESNYPLPPFNRLKEAINLSIFGENNPADDQAAGYRKARVDPAKMFSEDFALFLKRVRDNVDHGYPVIAYTGGRFFFIHGYLEGDNGEITALYFMDPFERSARTSSLLGGRPVRDPLVLYEYLCGVQHGIYYLW